MGKKLFIWTNDANDVGLKDVSVKIEQTRGTAYFATDTKTNAVGGVSIDEWDGKPFTVHVGKTGYSAQSKDVALSDLVRCNDQKCEYDVTLKKKQPSKVGGTIQNIPAFDFQKPPAAQTGNPTKGGAVNGSNTKNDTSKKKTNAVFIVASILVSLTVIGAIIFVARKK